MREELDSVQMTVAEQFVTIYNCPFRFVSHQFAAVVFFFFFLHANWLNVMHKDLCVDCNSLWSSSSSSSSYCVVGRWWWWVCLYASLYLFVAFVFWSVNLAFPRCLLMHCAQKNVSLPLIEQLHNHFKLMTV